MKTINISSLKAHLSGELKAVKDGETIIVLDRNRPVAKITSVEQPPLLDITLPVDKLQIPSISFSVSIENALEYLLEDRESR